MSYPLFALNTVLFPGCVLDLQVFEARYLDMISRCMRQGSTFGVVCILDGAEVGEAASQLAALGCEAQITDFQQLPNGLLGIRVEGGRRFRVERAEVQPDQLTQAQVTWLDEPDDQPINAEQADLAALLAALSQHPHIKDLGMGDVASSQLQLANQLAYLLPLEPQQKLQVLEADEASQRLALINGFVEQLQNR